MQLLLMEIALYMVSINYKITQSSMILSGIIDNLLHNTSIVDDKHGMWAQQLREMQFWENMHNLPMYLRRRWVSGAKEWLSGLHGSKENDKDKLGYTDHEWDYIWSSMLVDRAWSLPAITDHYGNPIKDNLAPELFIKFIAHDVRCHIIVFDLTLDIIQFCSANHLKSNNSIFDAPILLYCTGNHFQAVHPTNQDYFVHYARNLEYSQSNANAEDLHTSETYLISTLEKSSVNKFNDNFCQDSLKNISSSVEDQPFEPYEVESKEGRALKTKELYPPQRFRDTKKG